VQQNKTVILSSDVKKVACPSVVWRLSADVRKTELSATFAWLSSVCQFVHSVVSKAHVLAKVD